MSLAIPHGGRSDPALDFWLRYVESEGALTEDHGERTIVLLTQTLQERLEIPEEISVTADPEVAREEGAWLLLPGHPTLDRAASTLLANGDAGYAHLPQIPGPPISLSALMARLRDQVPIDHGRLEITNQPVVGYLPVLRVGALLRYAVSLEHRFQEREEVFVDARTGTAIPPDIERAILACSMKVGAPTDRVTFTPDLPHALKAAHSRLIARAEARREALSAEAANILSDELARADAYYRTAIESIEHRIERSSTEHQELLHARAEATRAEAARRRIELEEQHEAFYEIHPFRLHLIGLPALLVPVEICRGTRRVPLTLTLLQQFDVLLAPNCPACGAERATLVAGKEHLGCRKCIGHEIGHETARSSSVAEPAGSISPLTPADSAITTQPEQPSQQPRALAISTSGNSNNIQSRPGMVKVAPEPNAAQVQGQGQVQGQPQAQGRKATALNSSRTGAIKATSSSRVQPLLQKPASTGRTTPRSTRNSAMSKTGYRLATALWSAAGGSGRWKTRETAAYSPISALLRLYGASGPALAIGMLPGEIPEHLSIATYSLLPGPRNLTEGTVFSECSAYT